MIVGVGIDLVDVPRIKRIIRLYPKESLQYLFSYSEIKYCQSRPNTYEHFAARFAAKEAFLKAIGIDLTLKSPSWRDIEVIFNNLAPCLRLHRKAKEIMRRLRVKKIHLSLTHNSTIAAAIVTIEK